MMDTSANTLNRAYVALSSFVFILSLITGLYRSGSSYFTVVDIQLSFIITLVFTAAFLIFSYRKNQLNMPIKLRAILVTSICLRICYTLFTDAGTRTYDVYRDKWGHLDYIKHLAQHFTLPPVNECQAYHPPVHHIIAALALDLSKLFAQKEFYRLKFIQFVMVVISSLTLLILYKLLKELNCSNVVILTGISFFAFHPTSIYFSSRINNDNTLLFFYTLAFFFLVKWLRNNTLKNIVYLALTASLALLTKFSGIILIPLIAFTFTIVLIRKRSEYIKYVKQYAVFGLIFLPLSMSYQIRNYILFNQGFGYVPYLGKGFTPTFYNLIFIPLSDMLKHPFNNGGIKGGDFFLEFFLKSSLFGEWSYPGMEILAVPMLLLVMAVGLIIMINLLWINKESRKDYRVLLLLNLIIPVLLEMKLRTDLPTACSQDFRYAAPILVSAAFFIGETVRRLEQSKLKILKYLVIACSTLFCILSIIFVLSLGFYN